MEILPKWLPESPGDLDAGTHADPLKSKHLFARKSRLEFDLAKRPRRKGEDDGVEVLDAVGKEEPHSGIRMLNSL